MALFYDFVTADLAGRFPAKYPPTPEGHPQNEPGKHGNWCSLLGDGPPPADMWRDWSAEVRAVALDVGPLPPPDEGRRGEGGPKL